MIDSRLVDLFVETWNEMDSKVLTEDNINWGWCYQFALVMLYIYGGEIQYNASHAWLLKDGIMYDSENLEGGYPESYDWYELEPNFCLEEFKDFWANSGISGPVREDIVLATVTKYQTGLGFEKAS